MMIDNWFGLLICKWSFEAVWIPVKLHSTPHWLVKLMTRDTIGELTEIST